MDVQIMTTEQVGCYCLMLFNCYNNGGTIPSDTEELRILCHGIKPASKVLKKFYAMGESLRHIRVDEEIKKLEKFTLAQSENAKKRWYKAKNSPMPSDMPRHSHGIKPASIRQCSSSSSLSSLTPLPPKGVEDEKKIEAEKKLIGWFKTMQDVSNPEALSKTYLKLYPAKIILAALKDPNCTSRSKFIEACKFKLKEFNKNHPNA